MKAHKRHRSNIQTYTLIEFGCLKGKVNISLTNGITKLTFPIIHPKKKVIDRICNKLNLIETPVIEVVSNCLVSGVDILNKRPNERQLQLTKGNVNKHIQEQIESEIKIPRYMVVDYIYEPTETYFSPIDAFLKD